jgi:hypothetical protein
LWKGISIPSCSVGHQPIIGSEVPDDDLCEVAIPWSPVGDSDSGDVLLDPVGDGSNPDEELLVPSDEAFVVVAAQSGDDALVPIRNKRARRCQRQHESMAGGIVKNNAQKEQRHSTSTSEAKVGADAKGGVGTRIVRKQGAVKHGNPSTQVDGAGGGTQVDHDDVMGGETAFNDEFGSMQEVNAEINVGDDIVISSGEEGLDPEYAEKFKANPWAASSFWMLLLARRRRAILSTRN